MNRKKVMRLVLIGIAIAIAIFAILKSGILFGKNNSNKVTGKVKIGFSIDSLNEERRRADKEIFLAKAEELGAEVITQIANNDSNTQIKQIESFMDQNVDVLVIIPTDSDALMAVVKDAIKKGIKVISYDQIVRNSDVNLFMTFDYEKAGRMLAETLTKKISKGNFVIINGDDIDQNSILLNYGIHNVIDDKVANGQIKIIKEISTKKWNDKEAYDCIENVLRAGEKIDGIIAASDLLAQAAIRSLSEHKLAGKVQVVSQGATLSGCQRVVEGTQLITVYKSIKTLAQETADAAVKLAKEEGVSTTMTTQDGTYNVPVIIEDVIPVDQNNMVKVIVNNKFHKLEEIYKNLPQNKWPK